jgi:hypothetical protein
MPKSTASGRFAHDGTNEREDNSGGDSDHGSASGHADQGPSVPLFPPSVIAPFIALSQTGPAAPAASTSALSHIPQSSSSAGVSFPAPPPSSSSAPLLQPSSVISPTTSSSLPSAIMTPAYSGPSPPPSVAPSLSARSMNASVSAGTGKGKRKQPAVQDLDDHSSLKRRGPRTTSKPNPQPGDTAILHGFQGSMNHFSDIVQINNESQPHTILKDATSKLTGAWGVADKLTDGQKVVLLKLFRRDQAIASLYASTVNSRLRRGYVLSELEPYKDEVDNFDRDEADDNGELMY